MSKFKEGVRKWLMWRKHHVIKDGMYCHPGSQLDLTLLLSDALVRKMITTKEYWLACLNGRAKHYRVVYRTNEGCSRLELVDGEPKGLKVDTWLFRELINKLSVPNHL